MGGHEIDISPSEFLVLRDLFQNGKSSISETVARTGLAQSRVSTCAKVLGDRGLVTTSSDPADGRRTLVEVTEVVRVEGRRRRERSAVDALGAALAGAGADEQASLVAALERLHGLLVADRLPAGAGALS
jgi:DNA-binding MarR family transcriptional regulator